MIFSSVFFIFVFLPVVLLAYFLVPKKFKNVVILIASLIFYAWGEPIYIVLMVFSILFNYLSGLEIDDCKERGDVLKGKIAFWMAVGVNLGILGFFKYAGFVAENLNRILPFDISMPALALPIGISFYTFQTLSYIIDVYKGNVKVQKNVINFGTYISMFPQLIAGPIVRYADVEGQLVERKVTLTKFGEGTAWFLRGLAKKVLTVELGADVRYFTQYYAPDYAPAIGQFYLQNPETRYKLGGYPLVNGYLNIHLKRTRIFVMMYNLVQGTGERSYIFAPHYPLNPRAFKFGISWNFFD